MTIYISLYMNLAKLIYGDRGHKNGYFGEVRY